MTEFLKGFISLMIYIIACCLFWKKYYEWQVRKRIENLLKDIEKSTGKPLDSNLKEYLKNSLLRRIRKNN